MHKQEHYRLRPERPFIRSERENTTVLMGGLTHAHEQLVIAGLQAIGYKSEALPNTSLDAYSLGREHCSNGLCNPAYFTIGNLLFFLRKLRDEQGLSVDEICQRYVFYTAGSYGPCRFGMYESEYHFALQSAGFADFRVLVFQQGGGMVQSGPESGLDLDPLFFLVQLKSVALGDLVNELYHQIKPYELTPGASDKARARAIELLKPAMAPPPAKIARQLVQKVQSWSLSQGDKRIFALRWIQALTLVMEHLSDDGILKMLAAAMKPFDQVEVDRLQVKPVVKITGEFWAQTTESAGNYTLFKVLEDMGAELLVEPVSTWMDYLLTVAREVLGGQIGTTRKSGRRSWQKRIDRAMSRAIVPSKRFFLKAVAKLLEREYERLRLAAGGTALPLVDQQELIELSRNYYDPRLTGGEGYLEIGKTIHYTQDQLAHMVVSLKPFGCMPSTQSDGAQPAVLRDYPDILFLPIETSADGEGMALSRVQMMLAEARERARAEWHQTLQNLPYSLDAIRAYVEKNPQWRRGLLPLPQHIGKVLSASRFALMISAQMQREGWDASSAEAVENSIRIENKLFEQRAEDSVEANPAPTSDGVSTCDGACQSTEGHGCAGHSMPVPSVLSFVDASHLLEVNA